MYVHGTTLNRERMRLPRITQPRRRRPTPPPSPYCFRLIMWVGFSFSHCSISIISISVRPLTSPSLPQLFAAAEKKAKKNKKNATNKGQQQKDNNAAAAADGAEMVAMNPQGEERKTERDPFESIEGPPPPPPPNDRSMCSADCTTVLGVDHAAVSICHVEERTRSELHSSALLCSAHLLFLLLRRQHCCHNSTYCSVPFLFFSQMKL